MHRWGIPTDILGSELGVYEANGQRGQVLDHGLF